MKHVRVEIPCVIINKWQKRLKRVIEVQFWWKGSITSETVTISRSLFRRAFINDKCKLIIVDNKIKSIETGDK